MLAELRSLGQVDATQLNNDWRTRRAVERDEHIDVTILVDMVRNRLPDFEQFRDEILAYVQEN